MQPKFHPFAYDLSVGQEVVILPTLMAEYVKTKIVILSDDEIALADGSIFSRTTLAPLGVDADSLKVLCLSEQRFGLRDWTEHDAIVERRAAITVIDEIKRTRWDRFTLVQLEAIAAFIRGAQYIK